jgi:DNA mismatch repair protein MutL
VRDAILQAVADGLRPAAPVTAPRMEFRTVDAVADFQEKPVEAAPVASFRAPQPMLVDWEKTTVPEAADVEEIPAAAKGPDFRVIGMLHQRFVILESVDGLVLFDPKAAHDRIFYEKLVSQHAAGLETQGLLVPVLIELDPRETDLVLRERLALLDAGIEVEAFGGNTIQVRSLPACLGIEDPRQFLGELMDELLHDASPGPRFAFERVAKILSKRAATLVLPRLAETQALLAELFQCDLPYCTADGRPTLTEFGLRELERRFGISKG